MKITNIMEKARNLSSVGTRKLILLALPILIALLPTAKSVSASFPDAWEPRFSGYTDLFMAVTYGRNGFIIVGSGQGYVLSSPDGISWLAQASGTTRGLTDVTFGKDTYVAVGSYGTVITSNDGILWMSQNSSTNKHLEGITYGDGIFVAVGNEGVIISSSDGIHWNVPNSGTTYGLTEIAYGNGTFVAIGAGGKIFTSDDAVNWIPRISGTQEVLRGITFGDGSFVAVGGYNAVSVVLTSNDGVNWTQQNAGISNYLHDITYSAGSFVATGSYGTIITSSNAVSWEQRSSGTVNQLYGIGYGNGTFIAVGSEGTILTSTSADISRPVANAGPDQAVFDQVTFDGSDSYDSDGTIEFYEWTLKHREDSTHDRNAEGVNPTIWGLAPGFYDVALTVIDNEGLFSTDSMLLAVAGQCAGWPNPNTNLDVNNFRITKNKRTGKTATQLSGNIDLPALSVTNGDTVRSRITIELFGSLASGGDVIMSEEATLTVTETNKTLDIRK